MSGRTTFFATFVVFFVLFCSPSKCVSHLPGGVLVLIRIRGWCIFINRKEQIHQPLVLVTTKTPPGKWETHFDSTQNRNKKQQSMLKLLFFRIYLTMNRSRTHSWFWDYILQWTRSNNFVLNYRWDDEWMWWFKLVSPSIPPVRSQPGKSTT